jgi:transposase
MYLSRMQELEAKCAEAAAEMESIAAQDYHRQQTKKLTAFKGIKTLIALSFVTDIGDFRRFSNAHHFMAYLGLVPSERSSALNVAWVVSPRRATVTCGVCWQKPPGTTVAITPQVAI